MPTILSYYAQHCMHVPGKWIYYAQLDGAEGLLPEFVTERGQLLDAASNWGTIVQIAACPWRITRWVVVIVSSSRLLMRLIHLLSSMS